MKYRLREIPLQTVLSERDDAASGRRREGEHNYVLALENHTNGNKQSTEVVNAQTRNAGKATAVRSVR